MSPRGPRRSSQRPTGSAASADTASPSEKAPVTATREAPSASSIGRRNTG
jgi:hypothetical protein